MIYAYELYELLQAAGVYVEMATEYGEVKHPREFWDDQAVKNVDMAANVATSKYTGEQVLTITAKIYCGDRVSKE